MKWCYQILEKWLKKYWLEVPNHFHSVDVEPFIAMPNHIHGIATIHEHDRRGTTYRAPTKEGFGKPVTGSIPSIIRTF
jgi:putative transposase